MSSGAICAAAGAPRLASGRRFRSSRTSCATRHGSTRRSTRRAGQHAAGQRLAGGRWARWRWVRQHGSGLTATSRPAGTRPRSEIAGGWLLNASFYGSPFPSPGHDHRNSSQCHPGGGEPGAVLNSRRAAEPNYYPGGAHGHSAANTPLARSAGQWHPPPPVPTSALRRPP
jgi:hypothetical protein